MKRRYILAKPPRFGIGLAGGHGFGGPDDQQPARRGPNRRQEPVKPSGPALTDIAGQATKNISDALGAAFQKAATDLLPPGEVVLGAVLVVFGLLLATGLAGKGAKVGAFVATRGVIK